MDKIHQDIKKIEEKINDIDERLENIESILYDCMDIEKTKYEKMEKKIDRILELFDVEIKGKLDKMSNHVDWVDDVYTKVRRPLNYIVNKCTGGEETLDERLSITEQ